LIRTARWSRTRYKARSEIAICAPPVWRAQIRFISLPDQAQEGCVWSAESRNIVPTLVRVLRGRAGIVIERPQPVRRPAACIDSVVVVSARDRGLDRQNVIKRRRIVIDERVGEAVRMTGLLVGDGHDSRENRAREAGAADAVLVRAVPWQDKAKLLAGARADHPPGRAGHFVPLYFDSQVPHAGTVRVIVAAHVEFCLP
jgi:hypothetical protein